MLQEYDKGILLLWRCTRTQNLPISTKLTNCDNFWPQSIFVLEDEMEHKHDLFQYNSPIWTIFDTRIGLGEVGWVRWLEIKV